MGQRQCIRITKPSERFEDIRSSAMGCTDERMVQRSETRLTQGHQRVLRSVTDRPQIIVERPNQRGDAARIADPTECLGGAQANDLLFVGQRRDGRCEGFGGVQVPQRVQRRRLGLFAPQQRQYVGTALVAVSNRARK